MPVIAVAGEQQRLEARLQELQQARLMALGRIRELETELDEAETMPAQIEAAIGEVQMCLAQYAAADPPESEVTDEPIR